MRFLCLPGAFGSAQKFEVQLSPVIEELKKDGTITFHFTQGKHEAVPPAGYEDFFGGPPFFRFMEASNDPTKVDALERIRDFPQGASPEDTLRLLNSAGGGSSVNTAYSAAEAIQYVFEIVEKEGPFEGIVGYSEGSIIAGSLLLHEEKLFQETGRPKSFKLGMFFSGWPPLKTDFTGMVLADECEIQIPIATCHVIGSLDPYVDGCMALYNVCDPETAVLFDHAKGHTLPRDKETVTELAETIKGMIADIREREAEAA